MSKMLRFGRTAGAVAAIALALPASQAGAAQTCLHLPPNKVGLQLYSFMTELRPPGAAPGAVVDLARLDAVFGILQRDGWRNVENFGGDWGQGIVGYKAALDRHGLKVVASHDTPEDGSWPAALDRAKTLGQTYVGSGTYGAPGLDTLDHVLATAAHLNELGEQAAARGLRFYVHSHETEFKNTFSYDLNGDGRSETATAWEIIEANTNPRYVNFEVDIHWARRAMGLDKFEDLLSFLRKHRSRIVLLHIKDTTQDGKIADLGRGTTDWARLIEAAGPQIGYYLWEFDMPPSPAQSSKIASDYFNCPR